MQRFLIRACILPIIIAAVSAEPSKPKQPPHVVLIMADDMGWMDLACQGNEKLRTPKIDDLAVCRT